jgi:hypothetical protein
MLKPVGIYGVSEFTESPVYIANLGSWLVCAVNGAESGRRCLLLISCIDNGVKFTHSTISCILLFLISSSQTTYIGATLPRDLLVNLVVTCEIRA